MFYNYYTVCKTILAIVLQIYSGSKYNQEPICSTTPVSQVVLSKTGTGGEDEFFDAKLINAGAGYIRLKDELMPLLGYRIKDCIGFSKPFQN